MDHFSALPYELRAHIYSYYFSDNQPCTLRIAQHEPVHRSATKDHTLTIQRTASTLSKTPHTHTAQIAALLQQIQSTASALSTLTSATEAHLAAELTPHFPPFTNHSPAIAELTTLTHATASSLSVNATSSCRPFLTLSHLNQRTHADLLSGCCCPLHISGSMALFREFLPQMSPACQRSISFVHIVVGKEGGPYSVEVQEQFARLRALERLQTVYVSGVLDDADNPVDDEEEGGRPDDGAFSARLAWTYRGRSTWHLLRTLEQRSIRAVLCLDAYSERFARVYVRAGRWRKMARRFCGCCGKTAEVEADRERMREFLGTAELGRWLYIFEPGLGLREGCGYGL